MQKIKIFYTKHKTILFFIFLFVLLRIPSFFEPFWGNDDNLYATIAKEMQNGKVLYTDVFDHKPPLIFYTYFLGTGLDKLFYSKLLNLISGLIALIGIHILSKELINTEKLQKVSLGIFTALLATPVIQGTSVNAENYFITFSIWALIFVLKKKSKWHLFTAGSLFAVGFSYKFHPILEAASIGLFLAVEDGFNIKALKNTIKEKLLPYSAGFIATFTIIFALVTRFKNISDYIYAKLTHSAHFTLFHTNLAYSILSNLK